MHFFLSVLLDWPLFSAFIFRSLGLFFLFFFNESLHLCVHFLTTTQFLLLSSCNLTVIWLVLNSIEILFFKILPKKSIFFFQSLFSFRIHFWILDALSVEWKLLRAEINWKTGYQYNISSCIEVNKERASALFLSVLLDWPLFSSFNFRPLKISLWTRQNEPIFSPT